MVCPGCGLANEPAAVRCVRCGHSITDSRAASPRSAHSPAPYGQSERGYRFASETPLSGAQAPPTRPQRAVPTWVLVVPSLIVTLLVVGAVLLSQHRGPSRTPLGPARPSTLFSATAGAPLLIGTTKGEGSGFAVADPALIVTNAHVVDYGSEAEVLVGVPTEGPAGMEVLAATVVYHGDQIEEESLDDLSGDLALLRVNEAVKLPSMRLGRTESLKVGTDIQALGYPLGTLLSAEGTLPSPSYQRGYVSRLQKAADGRLLMIEHSAVLEPGNSGGPLLDAATGSVIGVNVAVVGYGTGMAIPIERVIELLEYYTEESR